MIYLFSLNLLLTVGLWRPFRPVFNNTKDSSSENLEITLVPFNVGPLFWKYTTFMETWKGHVPYIHQWKLL